jgi:hypothetical protein
MTCQCQRPRTGTLIDGRKVCTYCPDWRDECGARAILQIPRDRRRVFLFGRVENGRAVERGIEQIHGKEQAQRMAELVRRVWEARRVAAS